MSDPRPLLSRALDQTQRQIVAMGRDVRARPTPCGEYDAQTVAAHVVAVLRKLETVRRGGDAGAVADPADDVSGSEADAFDTARAALETAWAAEDALDASYTLPWGTMTGRDVLEAYTHEFTVHSWDLAVALDRTADLDDGLAEAALDWFRRNVPEDQRGEGTGFGPALAVPDDADSYTRLAGFVGRQVPTGQ